VSTAMIYPTLDDWLNKLEGVTPRALRAAEDLGPNWRQWLDTAWKLGSDAEREACAKIADNAEAWCRSFGAEETAPEIARMIRSRTGETK